MKIEDTMDDLEFLRRRSRDIIQFLAKIAIHRHRSARISSASLTSVAAAGTVTFRSL
jgi:hypothetical protein